MQSLRSHWSRCGRSRSHPIRRSGSWKPRSIASRVAPAGITVAGNGHIFWASIYARRILMCRELTPHGNVGGKVEYRGKQYSVIFSIGEKWK
jgi:hypothetical protein